MIWLYRLLFLPALVLSAPYYGLRMLRRGGYGPAFPLPLRGDQNLPPPATGM